MSAHTAIETAISSAAPFLVVKLCQGNGLIGQFFPGSLLNDVAFQRTADIACIKREGGGCCAYHDVGRETMTPRITSVCMRPWIRLGFDLWGGEGAVMRLRALAMPPHNPAYPWCGWRHAFGYHGFGWDGIGWSGRAVSSQWLKNRAESWCPCLFTGCRLGLSFLVVARKAYRYCTSTCVFLCLRGYQSAG